VGQLACIKRLEWLRFVLPGHGGTMEIDRSDRKPKG